jgi:hypothetical protein
MAAPPPDSVLIGKHIAVGCSRQLAEMKREARCEITPTVVRIELKAGDRSIPKLNDARFVAHRCRDHALSIGLLSGRASTVTRSSSGASLRQAQVRTVLEPFDGDGYRRLLDPRRGRTDLA